MTLIKQFKRMGCVKTIFGISMFRYDMFKTRRNHK